ncbi:hypothetical protein B0T10DRAFT_563762 [Thelonectria olida]|uniref:Uncharacterized protein n=1 Tax=Thelonectria olida TaxID=1576542 RepID=A0A9P8W0H2_9HYPO|nr:hypothetical protein B0T10DRAFT_563762 [Thelonectria olida]
MDIFGYLPAELRLDILCQCDSREGLFNLCNASPVMHYQTKEYPLTLIKKLLQVELPGHLLQDALAVLLFPDVTNMHFLARRARVQSHLLRWAKKDFPHPVEETDGPILYALNALVCRMKLFIEDYVSKATSPELRKAYMQLPTWATFTDKIDLNNVSKYSGKAKFHDLTTMEQNRLMKGFLQYELMCKIHTPQPTNFNAFASEDWEWNRLLILECSQLPDDGGDKADHSSPELLQCVHEYMRTLYGALVANSGRAVLNHPLFCYPRMQQHIPIDGSLPFPYHDQFEPELLLDVNPIRFSMFNCLASFGFDLALTLLTSEKTVYECFLDKLWTETFSYPPLRVARSGPANYQRVIMITAQSSAVFRDGMVQFWGMRGMSLLQTSLRRVYRQRAWAFLDSTKFYPRDSRFNPCYVCHRYHYNWDSCHSVAPRDLPTYQAWGDYHFRQGLNAWTGNVLHFWVRDVLPKLRLELVKGCSGVDRIKRGVNDYPSVMDVVTKRFWQLELTGLSQL